MKRDALGIFKAALAAADPEASTLKSLRQLKLNTHHFDRIFVIAIGKAASGMAAALENFIGKQLTAGIALTKYAHTKNTLRRIKIFEAAHPMPDAAGFQAAQQIEALLRTLNARDLLLTAISGGASALLSAPAPGISLSDKQRTTDLLLRAGAEFSNSTLSANISRA